MALITNDRILTLLLSEPKSNADIEKQIYDHLVREKLPIKPAVILSFDDLEYTISLDEPAEKSTETIDTETLPYKVKAAYRPGSNFIHDTYGTGTVVAAASSGTRSGEPDSRGMVDWIEVDFGKPYVSGGQLKNTRRFEKVYTSISPLLSK